MPAKYHIHTAHVPPHSEPVGKYGIVDWREDCSSCHNCVKRECAYSVYNDERDRLLHASDEYVDYLYECKGCLCCVQSCTKGLLSWEENPQYAKMGDEVWTPDIISSTWYQAETGKTPVSGAGYPGPFRGPGFDSILTDMSEIVRPTRDGIHGREYISTSVDIGRKAMKLEFDPDGALVTQCPPVIESPIPVLFNARPWQKLGGSISEFILDAAQQLGTMAITDDPTFAGHTAAIPLITMPEDDPLSDGARIALWADSEDVLGRIDKARTKNPSLIAAVKLPLCSETTGRALELARGGADVIYAFADWHGVAGNKHITIAMRDLHREFVKAGIRDEVTIITSGGISLAEHVIKTLLCGADMVCIDLPLVLALECRLCMNCRRELACPVDIANTDHDYAVQRIMNLIGAWHDQMLEMMGAMGIREARRLRGETGRAMFFDDLERDCFGPVFGERCPHPNPLPQGAREKEVS